MTFRINALLRYAINLFLIERRKNKLLRFRSRKGKAVKNWRSKAWSIDPKVTNLTIIKDEAVKLEILDTADVNLNFPQLLKNYPQYFGAIADMEQFSW